MKKQTKLILMFSVFIVYSGLFFLSTFLGKIGTGFYDVALFSLGVGLGIGILFLDESYFYRFYVEKKTTSKKYLVTRSLIFMLTLIPLGLFLMTSTGSALGVGMFLGIVSGLSIELLQYRSSADLFKDRFLSQLKKNVHQSEIDKGTIVFVSLSILYGVLTLFFGR